MYLCLNSMECNYIITCVVKFERTYFSHVFGHMVVSFKVHLVDHFGDFLDLLDRVAALDLSN